MTGGGSFPALRMEIQGRPRREAIKGPKKNPRASRQMMEEIIVRGCVARMWVVRWEIIDSVVVGQRKIGKMSRKS